MFLQQLGDGRWAGGGGGGWGDEEGDRCLAWEHCADHLKEEGRTIPPVRLLRKINTRRQRIKTIR